MFGFIKKICGCESESERIERRLKAAHRQDKKVREALTERQIDKGLKDTMAASDPVAKY